MSALQQARALHNAKANDLADFTDSLSFLLSAAEALYQIGRSEAAERVIELHNQLVLEKL